MAADSKAEFGDFQTPPALAAEVCGLLAARGIEPRTVVEPTCGVGHFLAASRERFPAAVHLGYEINESYVQSARRALGVGEPAARVKIEQANFFGVDWPAVFRELPSPILVLGNPPWVTSAQLGTLGSDNVPRKGNFQGHVGLDALTGKSNFDISEWMVIRLFEALAGRQAWVALLCKTAVARKALAHAWKAGIPVEWAEMRVIDAAGSFGAAVDACLLVCSLAPHGSSFECGVFPALAAARPAGVVGFLDEQLVADTRAYRRWKHLAGGGKHQWRSGVKHDCSKVMELRKEPGGFRNGLGELAELEAEYVFPMLKSSNVANGHTDNPNRWMLVPQRATGDDTGAIRRHAPKTWEYLLAHGADLDRRASSIYKKRPRFSVFGVGDYTFAPWKVAISGFYKRLTFAVVGNSAGQPTVFDDTVYFLPCRSEHEARSLAALLNSDVAREFFSAYVFWDAKRPITVDLLKKLNLVALAREIGGELTVAWGETVGPQFTQPDLFHT